MNRNDWGRRQSPRCWVCELSFKRSTTGSQTHEIARGPFKQAAMLEPAAWIQVCQYHHSQMGPPEWPIVKQLALKKLKNPEHYDRRKVNLLRGRQPEAITEAEVDAELLKLKGE